MSLFRKANEFLTRKIFRRGVDKDEPVKKLDYRVKAKPPVDSKSLAEEYQKYREGMSRKRQTARGVKAWLRRRSGKKVLDFKHFGTFSPLKPLARTHSIGKGKIVRYA